MANDPNDPNQQNQASSNTAGSNQYGASTPGSSTSSAGPGAPAPTTPGATTNSQYNQARQQKGTGFTNIQQILNANQGYGQRIGQQIGQGLQTQQNNVNSAINTGQNEFNTKAKSAYDSANSGIAQGQALQQQAGESSDDYANRLAGNNVDYSTIGQNIQSAKYGGPNALSNAGQIQSQAATASALGRLAGSTGGQNQLLSNMVAKRGNYTQGDTSLDQLLLGKGGEQYVQQGAQGLSNIGNTANNAIAGAQNQATNYSNAIGTNKQSTLAALQNQLSGAGDSTSNGITGFTTMAQKQGQDYNNNVSRLGQLLAGTDGSGAIDYSKLGGTDRDLLTHLSDYGLGDSSLYTHLGGNQQEAIDAQANGLTNAGYVTGDNSAAIKAALGNLGSNLNLSQGGSLYKGNQSQAAQNLASLLGQSDIKSNIANNKFNTNNFDPTSAFSGLESERVGDKAAQDYYSQQAALGGNIHDVLAQAQAAGAKYQHPYDQQLNTPADVLAQENQVKAQDPQYQASLLAQVNLQRKLSGQPQLTEQQASGMDLGAFASQLGGTLNHLSQNPTSRYYSGQATSQGGVQALMDPNNWKNSSYFSDLGNQSGGQDQNLQQYILQHILNGGATS